MRYSLVGVNGNAFATKWARLAFSDTTEGSTFGMWRDLLYKWGDEYFKECFADLMALLLFEFPAEVYLNHVNLEWISAGQPVDDHQSDKCWTFIQRVTMVLGVYMLPDATFSQEKLEETELWRLIIQHRGNSFIVANKENILQTLCALYVEGAEIQPGDSNDPPEKLIHVRNYLLDVKLASEKLFCEDLNKADSKLLKLRQQYKEFFLQENLFSNSFNAYLAKLGKQKP